MKMIIAFLFLFMTSLSQAGTVRVAVIDTGFDFDSKWVGLSGQKTFDGKVLRRPKLCKTGHKDFSNSSIKDTHGHGTHIAGIIATYAEDADYCLVIIKYIDMKSSSENPLNSTTKAINYAVEIEVDVINYASGGKDFDFNEYKAVKKALDKGIVVVAAAGNDANKINHVVYNVKKTLVKSNSYDIDITHTNNSTLDFSKVVQYSYYPANYDKRIYSVVNTLRDGVTIAETSNRGASFTNKAVGTNVRSILPNNNVGPMTGTSQATPKITARIIKGLQDIK